MAVRKVLIWPDPALQKKSELVTEFDTSLKMLVQDMIQTMEAIGNSAGLAAPQIGVHKRLFIADIPPEHNDGNGTDGPELFINPEFILKEGQFEWEEGCLSIPGERGKVQRAYRVIMRYQDLEGNTHQREAFDYLSGCFQHEADHLDGKLWIDYQSSFKKELVRKKMLKLKASL
ncbi:MAG: peptide deformylase [Myxococcaceae bacterium]|nr:peptide deformylase [Myxococcaceae bacterium]MBH2006345.1 peptide deformylase [Myxococcaceae bacterium]